MKESHLSRPPLLQRPHEDFGAGDVGGDVGGCGGEQQLEQLVVLRLLLLRRQPRSIRPVTKDEIDFRFRKERSKFNYERNQEYQSGEE